MRDDVQAVGRLLRRARRVLFITGAGVSAESGIPTFRGRGAAFACGMTEDGIPFETALSGPTFQQTPEVSWKHFFQLAGAIHDRQPNAAHRAIAALQSPDREVWVATQNIDGLHQLAGSQHVIELHGTMKRVFCPRCDYLVDPGSYADLPPLPCCPKCRGVLRPDIVLYEEMLPEAAMERFHLEQEKGFDLVFSVGTTSIFHYVIEPVLAAARRGTPTVEINVDETSISDLVRHRFAAPAGRTMEQILAAAAGQPKMREKGTTILAGK
jgi:NAD-dependent deacetylase